MKKIVVLVLIAFLFSCNKDVVYEDLPVDDLKSGKKVTKNIVLRNMEGTFTYEENPGDETCPRYAITSGTGNVTHLGKSHFQHKYCCDELGNPIYYIEGFVQAANDDKFFTMVTEERMGEDGLQHIKYDIIGGTGRFEDCSGELTMTVLVDWLNFTFTAEGYGTISY